MPGRVGPEWPDEKGLGEAGGRRPGESPGAGRASERDEGLEDGTTTDPSPRSPLPGFVDQADPVEEAVEGTGVAEARNAVEDLPRQG